MEKVFWAVKVFWVDLEAGPFVQSNLTYDREAVLVTVKWEPSKVIEPT